MSDNFSTVFQTIVYLDLESVTSSYFDLPAISLPVLDYKDAPDFTLTKQRARGSLQHIFVFPHDNSAFDAITVAKCLRGLGEVSDHVDSLLFHAKRGNLSESGRLNKSDAGLQC